MVYLLILTSYNERYSYWLKYKHVHASTSFEVQLNDSVFLANLKKREVSHFYCATSLLSDHA